MSRTATIPPVDQAARLRALVSSLRAAGEPATAPPEEVSPQWACPLVVVASGKGGVGKSCLSILLARACAEAGVQTLLADVDLGAANLDVLLRTGTRRRIDALWRGEADSIATPVGLGFRLIAGVSGGAAPEAADRRRMLAGLARASEGGGLVIADAGAGLGPGVIDVAGAAHLVTLVVTPDPASITDAYALFKTLAGCSGARVGLIVNQARDDGEGLEIYGRIALAGERFVGTRPALIGVMTENESIRRAARAQRLGDGGAVDELALARARACGAEVRHLAAASLAGGGSE